MMVAQSSTDAADYTRPRERKSDDFYAPAFCRPSDTDTSSNEDRENIVCALGLDIHYELNVVGDYAGAHQKRFRPFNPAKHSPACPYNYTGRFVSESEYEMLCKDPVGLGKRIKDVVAIIVNEARTAGSARLTTLERLFDDLHQLAMLEQGPPRRQRLTKNMEKKLKRLEVDLGLADLEEGETRASLRSGSVVAEVFAAHSKMKALRLAQA